jgi:hypothetical protein
VESHLVMRRTIELLRADAVPECHELVAAASAGGSGSDDLRLPGAPPGAVRLVPADAGVVVEIHSAGVRAAGKPAAPGSRRLVVAGERVEVLGHVLTLLSDAAPDGTRAIAGALLREAAAGAAPMTAPHLVVLTGPRAGLRVLVRETMTVGRGRAADVVLPDPEASRVHAEIHHGGDAITVEDLRSKNGVRVNGVRVDAGRQPLRPGDELTVGETVLRLVDPLHALGHGAAPPSAAARPERRRRPLPPELAAAALLVLSAAALALAS